ncbi:MAG: hypothetical protein QJR00_02970, partial [Bacillota bacterium]|nr:hypothetical protein [Bacillota bacterium]
VLIALVVAAAGVPFPVGPWALGALGWLVALGLRGRLALMAKRLEGHGKDRAQWVVVGASGPAEGALLALGFWALLGGWWAPH